MLPCSTMVAQPLAGLPLAKSQKLLGRGWNHAGRAEPRKVEPESV